MTAQGGFDFADTCERIIELALAQAAAQPSRHLRDMDLP
jgi:hypothetical protein